MENRPIIIIIIIIIIISYVPETLTKKDARLLQGGRSIFIWLFLFRSHVIMREVKILRTFAPKKFPRTDFFLKLARQKGINILLPKKLGSPTSFWREHALKNTPNLKNRASLADKATVSVSPKILQLDL